MACGLIDLHIRIFRASRPMIGRITGTLLEKNPPQILVNVHGVGYEIDVPMSTFYNLPATGGAVSLHTHLVVREDGHFLFGFATDEERATFRQLLKVSGVGARMALAVLSGLSVNDLAQAVALQEAGRLVKIPASARRPPSACCWNCATSSARGCPTWRACAWPQRRAPLRTRRATSSMRCWRWATTSARPLSAMKGLAEDVGVSDGIRQALKAALEGLNGG